MDTHVLIEKATVEFFTRTGRVPRVENDTVVFDGAGGAPTSGAGTASGTSPDVTLVSAAASDSPAPAFPPIPLSGELVSRRAGTFATIHTASGDLRGCIGTIAATQANIAEEIIHNAVCSCSQDPRFPPVTPQELDALTYSVDVLGDIEPIDSPAELDVKRYGVIVTSGFRRGLLLPNLDGVPDVETQIAIARRKGGIRPGEPVELARFEVVRHT